MREPEAIELGGDTFTVVPLGAMKAAHLSPLVQKGLRNGLDRLLDSLDGDEYERLIRAMLDGSLVNSKPLMPVFDTFMMGRQADIVALVMVGIRVNYEGFFVTARGAAGAESSSTSPTT